MGRPTATAREPPRTAYSVTGSAMPLRCLRPRAEKVTSPEVRVRLRTVSVTSTSPAAACPHTRAAMLTADPTNPSSVSTGALSNSPEATDTAPLVSGRWAYHAAVASHEVGLRLHLGPKSASA